VPVPELPALNGRERNRRDAKEKQDFARTQLTRGQNAWSRRWRQATRMVEAVI